MNICEWLEDEGGQWWTDCANVFEFTNDGPQENGFAYCPYCGGRLSPISYQPVPEGA